MINYWETLALYIAVTCLIFTMIGFISPVLMLWWEDTQNRKKVLKYYATTGIVAYLTHWIIKLLGS